MATFTGGYWHPRWLNDIQWNLRGTQRWVHWDPSRTGTGGVLEIHGPQPQFMAMEETFELPPDDTPGYVLETIDRIYESSRSGRRVEA